MSLPDPYVQPMQDHTAHLEQAFIEEFIHQSGHDPARLGDLPAADRDLLLKHAALYAAGKLAEVEARAHYLHELHGGH